MYYTVYIYTLQHYVRYEGARGNFEGCLFLKKNIGTFGDDFGPCPDEFVAPNKEDCPPSELCNEDDSDSECSDIVISSDDES